METTSYIALSRQGVLRREMDLVANNLANVNTPAFRGESMMFVEHLAETQRGETGRLSFVEDIAVVQDLSEGPMEQTGNALDAAIDGEGYFVVETDDGPRYTRNGSFKLSQDNELVTDAGYRVLDQNGNPIEIPDNAVSIEISEDGAIATENGQVATLDLVTFGNEQALRKQADGLFDAGDLPVLPADGAGVKQGMLEGSNVKGVVEMTRMIELVRSYQGAQKMVDGDHERQLRAIRTLVESA
jgi:flagellar basal-body rod protein FlgF